MVGKWPFLSPFTALVSRGWGPQSWTHPTVAPQLSQPDRLTVGSRTPEPRGGQCARVPRSFFKVSASWVCSSSGALEACGSYPRALLLDREPQGGLRCRCTGAKQCWAKGTLGPQSAQVRGPRRGPRLGANRLLRPHWGHSPPAMGS